MPALTRTPTSNLFGSALLVACLAGCQSSGQESPGTSPQEVDIAPVGQVLGQRTPVSLDPTKTWDPNVDACAEPLLPQAPIRRLTNLEYRNSIADILGRPALANQVTAAFISETESLGFRNSAQFLRVTPLIARQYMDAAEELAAAIRSDEGVLGCQPSTSGCATQVIINLGRRLYRRPLSSLEVSRYQMLFSQNVATLSAEARIEAVLSAMFQSPHFLHRIESVGSQRPTSLEMATRLSFLFWRSAPDNTLLDLAMANGLETREQVAAIAQTMLDDERAKRGFSFFEEWLDIDRMSDFVRSANVFSELSETLPESLRQQAEQFVHNEIFDGDGSFATLFTSRRGYYNGELQSLHNLEANGAIFSAQTTDENAGILTLGGFVTAHDKPSRTSIVERGLAIRTNILCQNVGAPPDDVPLTFPELDGTLSQKERLEQHRTNPKCAGCHDLTDPLGVIFENFDALGRHRTEDRFGQPIDATSEVAYTQDADGPITGGVPELAARFSESDHVRACFTTQLFRYAFGRDAFLEDACTMQTLQQKFAESGYNVRSLMLALTQTDAFWASPAGE